MAASYNDQAVLATDVTFKNRVQAALVGGALTLQAEASTVANHYRRVSLSVLILNNPAAYSALFVQSVATDTTVIADATQAGTVVLTTGNVAAQAALVTDAHILAALNAQINSFVSPF